MPHSRPWWLAAERILAKSSRFGKERGTLARASVAAKPCMAAILTAFGRKGVVHSRPLVPNRLYVANRLLTTIMNGPQYRQNQVAIIISFDENGGHWDHVAPPRGMPFVTDQFGPGSRIPGIVISPWAKRCYVDHTFYDNSAILAFIERNWNLTPVSTRDTVANPFSNSFDFLATPATPGACAQDQAGGRTSTPTSLRTATTVPPAARLPFLLPPPEPGLALPLLPPPLPPALPPAPALIPPPPPLMGPAAPAAPRIGPAASGVPLIPEADTALLIVSSLLGLAGLALLQERARR